VPIGSVIIKNLNFGNQGETIFVAEPKYSTEKNYCLAWDHWKTNSNPKLDNDSRFCIEPCDGKEDRFLIRSERFDRYLYAGKEKLDENCRYVLMWNPDKNTILDASYQWKIINHGEYYSI
jgi:hypothetical protein